MKNLIFLLVASLFHSCGPLDDSGNPAEENSNFSISIEVNATPTIDETISILVTGNEPLKSVYISIDGADSGTSFLSDDMFVTKFNYSFDKEGSRTFKIKATNLNDVVRERIVSVSVSRGNSIKITSVQVISFYNIHQTWDPEYSESDPNRLADIKFAFEKPKIHVFDDQFGIGVWFISSVKENQGDLTWNLSSENLYIDPNFSLRFGLGDNDGNGIGQDLMLGPPFSRELNLSQYIVSRPNTITLSVPEINLEAVLMVEWPN